MTLWSWLVKSPFPLSSNWQPSGAPPSGIAIHETTLKSLATAPHRASQRAVSATPVLMVMWHHVMIQISGCVHE